MTDSEAVDTRTDSRWQAADTWVAAGLFLLVLSTYILASPGRIDIVDGQARFEVSRSLVEHGDTVIRDRALGMLCVFTPSGRWYSWYGPSASALAVPAVWLGLRLGDARGELAMVLFSYMSPLFGAGLAVLLYVAFRRLATPPMPAAGWTAATAFTTLLWPVSASSFDQTQHAFFLFAAVWLAYESGRRRSIWLAAAGGLFGGVLLNFNESYAIVLPAAAVAAFAGTSSSSNDGRLRYLAFGATAGLGFGVWVVFNLVRLGTIGSGKPVPLQPPLAGLLSLAVSPGRSVFLFSPPLVLAVLGFRRLLRRAPALGTTVLLVTAVHLAFISSVAYFGGDWCWGPRYVVPLLPLWALALPFARARTAVASTLVASGIVVQLMALSVDHQRFFFEHGLKDHFWMDRWAYFKVSQLVSRPAEIRSVLLDGPPHEAAAFLPVPHAGDLTYALFGNPQAVRHLAPQWMRQFLVFYVPRPWPFWMPLVDKARAPYDAETALRVLLGGAAAGCLLLLTGLRKGRRPAEPTGLERG